ncbi:aromatic-ring-hydroxylating dioxygenase subunit beta [Extensimonas vulgaris]|uniref:3-phenylpropionate/cinnamic acid dioxygenase small subunit n=1 Tax=Extensimonas vulgaris TaxID=1031594 RepID=A0A369AMM7_9BURK|nr:aromatic-ring-hydroxylating dioxygenase subunit beta [Extensimonas vulgaris]RCX10640.1 3-phenylpropionate/cinnamic acid dioxygenase small subunit [Extensimonas vulgaris]TWI41282.1 3-phenylpropionate/cinnamic acid dioxygenase small subunit [Extensimonas vulgaris]
MTTMTATKEPTATSPVSEREYRMVCDFLYMEARLADESRYLEWEALVEDDMVYWVPLGEGDFDMNKHVSIIADNRSRLRTRIAQLATGKRHAQVPVSPMRRLLSNIEVQRLSDDSWKAQCNFVLYELRKSSTGKLEVWPGRVEYHLRRRPDGSLGMFLKKVMLVNGEEDVPSLAFII